MRLQQRMSCLVVLLSACGGAYGEPSSEIIDPTRLPEQTPLVSDDALPRLDDVFVTPRARYRIAARVLSSERYYLGERSDFSPLDLALGWGAMSDPSVDEWIDWHQGGRWYFWQWSAGSPYRNEQIREQSANVHIVPGNGNLRRALLALHANDIVLLEGYLVAVDIPGGESLPTSLSRTDTGSSSCEQLLVTALTIDSKTFR